MKIKYKDIVIEVVPEEYFKSCRNCYFHYNQGCMPYYACRGTIMKKSESQVFEL